MRPEPPSQFGPPDGGSTPGRRRQDDQYVRTGNGPGQRGSDQYGPGQNQVMPENPNASDQRLRLGVGGWPPPANGSPYGAPDASASRAKWGNAGTASAHGGDRGEWPPNAGATPSAYAPPVPARHGGQPAGSGTSAPPARERGGGRLGALGRDVSELATESLPAEVVPGRGRATRSSSRTWLARAALIAGLVFLVARAATASAAFMQAGGIIPGWSTQPVAVCTLCNLPKPVVNRQHPLTPAEYAAQLEQHLSLTDKIGQMVMIKFYDADVTPDAYQMIYGLHVGGVLLFGSSIQSASQVSALTSGLQKLAPTPLLVAVDQEGGSVNRFQTIVGDTPSAGSLADPAAARARGTADAQVLHKYGFNFNLAPVVDVGPAVALCCNRTFGSDPARVAAMAGAYVEGLQADGRVAACLKHFPGLGSVTTNPDTQMPYLNRSRADWESTDVAPYRTLLKTDDIRGIMVSPEMIPEVDPNLPSTLSPAFVTRVLRNELGFQGLIITDSLHTGSLSGNWTVAQAAVLAIEAGVDIALGPYTPSIAHDTLDAIRQAVRTGAITTKRIDESVMRILTLKLQLGLIPMPAAGPGRGGGQRGDAVPGGSVSAIVPGRAARERLGDAS